MNKEGNFPAVITKVGTAACRWDDVPPGSFDLIVEVQGVDGSEIAGQVGTWSGEMSVRQGRGNRSNQQQWQITMEELKKLGITDIAQATSLVGKTTTIWVAAREGKNGQTYFDVKSIASTGGGRNVTPFDPAAVAAQMQAMMAGAAAPQFGAAPAAPAASAAPVTQTFPPQQQAMPGFAAPPATAAPAATPFG